METKEVADQITEMFETRDRERAELRAEVEAQREERERERARAEARERFRTRAAVLIAVLAMLLAITNVGGNNVMEDIISKNVEVTNTWAFYQAKNIRQTDYRIGADMLEALARGGALNGDGRAFVDERIAFYRATADRYESEPATGEGKRELMEKGRELEAQLAHARRQDANLDLAEAMFQIAIVLGSVAILATSRPILAVSITFGVVATLFMLNGFFLFYVLPWS